MIVSALSRGLRLTLAGLLLFLQAADPAAAAPRKGYGSGFRIGAGTPVTAPAAAAFAYDGSIGAGVDSEGFAALPLRSGAHRYFVKPSGADGNTCVQAENPATPKATIASGVSCIASGNGDQLMLAEGATFSDPLPWFPSIQGYSPTYPTVIQSYDPADANNTVKYGRADQRNARPILTATADSNGNGGPYSYVAIKGVEINPGNVGFKGFGLLGGSNYILLENDIFAYVGISIDGFAENGGQHIIIRNSSIYGPWNDGRTGCVYIAGHNYPTIEDNVMYHCGWRIGQTRTFVGPKFIVPPQDLDGDGNDDPTPAYTAYINDGGPTIYSHTLYIQLDTNDTIVRRNLMMDGSADAGSLRGDRSLYTANVIIRNPIGTGLGSGYEYNIHRPTGVSFEGSYNLTLAGVDLDSQSPRGHAYLVSNGKPGSKVHHNLTIRNATSDSGRFAFGNNADYNQPSYVDFDDNIAFAWSNSGGSTSLGAAYPAQVHATFSRNKWDDPASGSNTQALTGGFTNPYTEAALYVAAGVTDYATLITLSTRNPQGHYARALRDLAFAGYGLSTGASSDTTAPTLSSPVGTATGASTATVGATTNEGNGTLYHVLTASSTAPSAAQVKAGQNNTGSAAIQAGSQAVSSTGAKTFNLTSLSAGTYYDHLMHEDGVGNQSNVVSSSSFTIAGIAATWDPASASPAPDWTFSNANLTVQRTGNSASNALVFATVGKSAGTVIFTVDALNAAGFTIVGLATATETGQLGSAGGKSIAWFNTGAILLDGSAVLTAATFAGGDQLEISRSGNIVSFYKLVTGSFVLQGTVDVSGYAVAGTVYPAVNAFSGFATDAKFTGDFTSW